MRKTATHKRYDSFNLTCFQKDFICAGIRDNIIGMYNFLLEKGAQLENETSDRLRISSRKPIVLLCKNNGITSKFGQIQIMEWNWWNYYHNKNLRSCKPNYYTYNLPSQWNQVLMEGCTWKEVEVLKPEVV